MKIALMIKIGKEYTAMLRDSLSEHNVIQINPNKIKNESELRDIDVVIGASVPKEVLEKIEDLKLFQVPWVGFNGVLPNIDYFKRKNIAVCNSKWNHKIVAEYALSLLLTLMKQIVPVHNTFSKGFWDVRFSTSKQLRGSSVLLAGFGDIGKELALLLQPFNTKIFALRNNPDKTTAEERKLVEKVIGWEDFEEVISEVTIIINSLPLTPNTENIFDTKKFSLMKEETLIVNVGRGKTMEEKPLFEALRDKKISGAAIDVWYNYKSKNDSEPFYPSQYPFHDLKNVIMSPHRSATFMDAPDHIWDDSIYNINALEDGGELKNKISFENGY